MVPGGVCVRALASRFANTWCSRAGSPVTVTDSSGRSSRQWWSGAATCASLTASMTRRDRSTGAACSGRPESSRASSSISSTSAVIRVVSDSTRRIACATSGGTASDTRRVSSAYPRIAANGVRSSWLASATKCRTRVSLACRAASASATWPSIRLSAAPTCPTSVRGSVSTAGTRTDSATSPRSSGSSATRLAVAATRRSGRRLRPMTVAPISPASSAAASPMAVSRTMTASLVA